MLKKEDLQNIIDQFDEDTLKSKGVFGIYQYGGGSDESYIEANKEGLELFALQLLKSARDSEMILADNEKKSIPFDYDEDWIDDKSSTFIQYVVPLAEKQKSKTVYKTTLIDRLMPIGCGLFILIILVSILVGLGTIIKWIF
jgi:hypothetical protein